MVHSKVSIIGAGISGLVLGRALKQQGIKTCVFEKARQSNNRNNYAITLYEKSYRPLLKLLNLEENAFRRKVAVGTHRGQGKETEAGREEGGGPLRANRARLEGLLTEGVDVKFEHELQNFESLPGSVELKFRRGGARHSSPIIVGADGPHSFLRQKILPEEGAASLKVLPFATYNGKRTISAQEWEGLKGEFEEAGTGVIEHRESSSSSPLLLQISLSNISEDDGSVLLSYTFSRPALSHLDKEDALYRPHRSKDEAQTTPQALFSELAALQSTLPEPFRSVFDPEAVEKDRLLNWLQRSLHLDPLSSEPLLKAAGEGIVLMGDAVHAEPILGGQGANEAILDAMELAEVIARDGKLREFYERRAGEWQRSVKQSEEKIAQMHGEKAKASL